MKRLVLPLLAALVLAAFALPTERLQIGAAAPLTDVQMKDVSGTMRSLGEIASEEGLLVIFSSNTCPYVRAWENRYHVLAEEAARLGIGIALVNSNAGTRDGVDSYAAMKERAALAEGEKKPYAMPYLVDEGSALADAFGATRTPDVFLFERADDGRLLLVYTGAIDDNARDASAVTKPYLLEAMRAMVAGQAIAEPVTRSVGCTIKRPGMS